MKARNLLYVDYFTFIAGGQVVEMNNFKVLDRRRYRPMLVVPSEGAFTTAARRMGVPVFVVPMKKARWRLPWQAIPAAWGLKKVIQQNHIDIVDANCYPANKIAGPAAWLAGVPCVWHKHILAKKRYSSTGFLWRLFARFNQRIVGSAEAVVRSLREMGIPLAKLRRIYYGIDIQALEKSKPLSALEMKRLKFPVGSPVVGVVAMHRMHKGIDIFLRACLKIVKKNKNAHFVVVGDPQNAEEKLEAEILRLAALPELRGRVHLYPGTRNVGAWMRRFTLLVSPSRWEVGAPLVPMEGMALGVPLVATDTSSGELVTHEKDGLIVPTGDEAALAGAVLRLLKDKALARRLAKSGQKTIREKYSLKRYGRELMEMYDEVAAQYYGS